MAPVLDRPLETSISTNVTELLSYDMEWTQDLPGDLDTFARLTRAGHFSRAETFYQEALEEHERFFPVAAEYGDMLIEQGAFGKAEDFLNLTLENNSRISLSNPEPRYKQDEVLVLTLLCYIAKIHTRLCFEDAVAAAEKALEGLNVSRSSGKWSGVEMRILVLSLRIINYNSANNALLNKASAPGVTLSEFVGKPSQPQTSQTWYDSALKNNNSIAQPWSTAELHRLGGPVHDEDPNAIGWMKTCDILLASEDADTFIAGVSVLAETCRRALVHLWRDLLSGPSSVPVEEQEESPQVENLFAKLDEMLGAHFENHWLRNLDEIDTPAKESHAYRYSMLMAYDRQLLRLVQKLKQDEFNLKIPPQYEMNRSLEDITKHAQENHDYRLQFDLLSRRVITSPISADGTVVGTIAALWRKTRNSWDCLKLLACVRRCLDTRSGEVSSLLDEINSYCGEAEKYLAGTPLLDLQQLLNYNNDHRTCDDLPDLMFFWQRTATAKNVSQLRTQHHLSLFDACIRGRTPVSSMPGGIVAPTGVGALTTEVEPKNVKRLLFLGHTGTGKSSTINALTGSKLLTSDHTDPCTSEIAIASCKLGEHQIECIDTPGFGDRRLSDVQVLRMVQKRLKRDHREDRRIHAVFYLINISTPRKDAALARDINVFLKLVGDGQEADDVWRNVCFIYTHGIDPNSTGKGMAKKLSSQATRLEDFARDLRPQLDLGARTCHLIEDTGEEAESYIKEVRQIALTMLKSPEGPPLQCVREMTERRMREDDTSAAVVLTNNIYEANDELQEAKRKKDKEITATQQAIDKSSSQVTKDESTQSSEKKSGEDQQLREELRRLKDEQAKLIEKRAKFLREVKEIEDATVFRPRLVVFNRSNVNVHLRVYSSPFHLVWTYTNNVLPGSFATLRCPTSGFYSLEVCLATGTSSEYTTIGQAGSTFGKVCLGGATLAGGAVAGMFASAFTTELVGLTALTDWAMSAGAAAGATYGSTDANARVRRFCSAYLTSTSKEQADISITTTGDLTADNYAQMRTMQSAVNGKHSLRLVKSDTMWLWRTKKLVLRYGPEVVLPEDSSTPGKVTYRFTPETKPLAIENREEFSEDAPPPPSPPDLSQHPFS